MYLAPQNIPRAISVLTLGNKVILLLLLLLSFFLCLSPVTDIGQQSLLASAAPVRSAVQGLMKALPGGVLACETLESSSPGAA